MGTSIPVREMNQGGMPGGQLVPQVSSLIGVLPARIARAAKNTFLVNLDVLGLAPGAARSVTHRVDPNFDFVAVAAYGKLRSADNLTSKDGNPVLVQLTDERGQSYSPNNGTLDFENFYGSGKQPAILIVPLIIEGPTGITVNFQNLHNADTLNIRTTLAGFLVAKTAGRR
jgi:hypothetical protein